MTIRVLIFQPSLAAYRIPVYRLLNGRPDLEVELVYIDDSSVPSVPPDGFTAHAISSRKVSVGGRPITYTTRLLSTVANRVPDVVVFSWNANEVLLSPALILSRLRGFGTVLWGHGYSLKEDPRRTLIRNRIAQLADAVLTYDTETAAHLRENPRLPLIFTAQNAIDTQPMKVERARWDRQRLDAFATKNRLEGRMLVLNVGRLIPERHLEVLVRATAIAAQSDDRVLSVIIGSGPERGRIESAINANGVADHVRILDGTYDEEALAPWFLSASVFCSPSHLGLGVFHAFAYGLPVITGNDLSAHPPEARALSDGHNGLMFDHDNPFSLARAILTVGSDSHLRSALAKGATQTVEEHYTVQRMVEGFQAAIHHAEQQRRRQR